MFAAARLACVVLTGLLVASAARSDEVLTQAQALNQRGVELVQAKRYDEAETVLNQAMQLCDGPLKGEHFCVAGVSQNLADIATARGDLPKAETLLARAAEVTLATVGQTPQYGVIELKYGRTLLQEQRYAAAELALRTGVSISNKARDAHRVVAGVLDLAQVLNHLQRPDEAEALLRRLLPVCAQAEATCEATTRGHLGESLIAQQRLAEGEQELRRSADLYASQGLLVSRDAALMVLARAQLEVGQFDEAQGSYQTLVANLRARPDTPPSIAGIAEADLARVLFLLDQRDKAAAMVATARRRVGDSRVTPVDAAALEVRVATLEIALRQNADAKALLQKALSTPDPLGLQAVVWRAEAEGGLGDLDYLDMHFAEAEAHFRKSAAIYGAAGDLPHNRERLNSVAQALIAQHRNAEAEALLNNLIAQAKAQKRPDLQGVANFEANLAQSRNDQNDYKGALAVANDALALFKPPPGRPQSQPVGILANLGVAETGLGQYGPAEAYLKAALAQSAADHQNPALVWPIQFALCEDYLLWGKHAEDDACARQLAALVKGWPEASAVARVSALLADADVRESSDDYEGAAQAYEAVLKLAESGQVGAERSAATAYVSLGIARSANAQPLLARAALAHGQELFAKLGPANEADRVEAGRRLGEVETSLGDLRAAEPRLREAVGWFGTHMGEQHPRTALQLRGLGLLLLAEGRAGEAQVQFQQALAIRENQPAPNLTLVAQSLADLADCDMALGHYDAARVLRRRVETVEADARGKTFWYVGTAARQTGELELASANFTEAEAAFRRAAPLLAGGGQAALADDLVLQRDVAALRVQQGRFVDARRELENGLARAQRAYGLDDLRVVASLRALATLDRDAGQFDAAEAAYRRVLAIQSKTIGERAAPQVGVWLDIASLKAATLRYEDAKHATEQALAIAKETGGLEGRAAISVLLRAADIEATIGEADAARDLARRALEIARGAGGDSAALQISALVVAGWAAQSASRLDEAELLFSEALSKSEALWGAGGLRTVWPLIDLADVERARGRFGEAAALLERARTIGAEALPAAHAVNVLILLHLAEARRAAGDAETAEQLAKEALSRLAAAGRSDAPLAGYAQLTLGRVYGAEGFLDEAQRSLSKARDLLAKPRQ